MKQPHGHERHGRVRFDETEDDLEGSRLRSGTEAFRVRQAPGRVDLDKPEDETEQAARHETRPG